MGTKHTPGPWTVKAGSWDEDGYVRYSLDGITDLKLADARLIAAAPELLEALEEVMDEISGRIELDAGTRFRVRAAICKATGEEA